MMKKVWLTTLLWGALLLAAATASAADHTWKVTLPADLPFNHCHIFFENDGGSDVGEKEIATGSSASWGAKTPLSYISGNCNVLNPGGNQVWRLQSRTCTGVDFTSGVEGGIRCETKLLRLKICPKVALPVAFPRDYQYGFCDE
ncbi:MAG: hypothetical protein M0009_12145 [Deltaproteobacteria bacterium]|nr:hypothetical protein [Deltaproteobacteria bacterium]